MRWTPNPEPETLTQVVSKQIGVMTGNILYTWSDAKMHRKVSPIPCRMTRVTLPHTVTSHTGWGIIPYTWSDAKMHRKVCLSVYLA